MAWQTTHQLDWIEVRLLTASPPLADEVLLEVPRS